MNILMTALRKILIKCVEDIDNGNSNLNEEETEKAINILTEFSRKDKHMSKYQAYTYLNMSRASFDNYIRGSKLPKGKKIAGFTELVWYKKDLNKAIKELRNNK